MSLYGAGVVAVVAASTQRPVEGVARFVVAVCGLTDIILGATIMFDAAGVAGSIHQRGLVHWIKPPWVARSWAEQPTHFAWLSRVFGAVFVVFGLLVVSYV
jgi:threonine/homoserine/homoserine lactone efflux protein